MHAVGKVTHEGPSTCDLSVCRLALLTSDPCHHTGPGWAECSADTISKVLIILKHYAQGPAKGVTGLRARVCTFVWVQSPYVPGDMGVSPYDGVCEPLWGAGLYEDCVGGDLRK